jgi:hypothetical protein
MSDYFKRWSECTIKTVNSNTQTELGEYGANLVITSPAKYITYNGVKILVKNIKVKTKNKFINRCVLKNVTPVSVTTEDLGDYKMGIDVKLRYNA